MSAKPILLPASISSGLLLSSSSLLSHHSLVLHFLTPPQALSSPIPQSSASTHATICPQFVPLQPQIPWCPATFALTLLLSPCTNISGCARLSSPFLHPLIIALSPSLSHCSPILLPFLLFCLPIQWLGPFARQPSLGRLPSPSECSLGDIKPCQLPMSLLEHKTVRQADANTYTHQHAMHISAHTQKHAHKPTHTCTHTGMEWKKSLPEHTLPVQFWIGKTSYLSNSMMKFIDWVIQHNSPPSQFMSWIKMVKTFINFMGPCTILLLYFFSDVVLKSGSWA